MAFGAVAHAAAEKTVRREKGSSKDKDAKKRIVRKIRKNPSGRAYNGPYTGKHLDRVAFPLGGIGAGMVCIEGTGALSHVSVRNTMDFFNEPAAFAALSIKGAPHVARVIEGPIPDWKYFGRPMTGRGSKGRTYGFPRFREASFLARFPFCTVRLQDPKVPLEVELTGWSPFIPGDADNSSLPVGAIEYQFHNTTRDAVTAVFSYNAANFMAAAMPQSRILAAPNGFLLHQGATESEPHLRGGFAFFVDDDAVSVDHCWFKGAHYDGVSILWENIEAGNVVDNPRTPGPAPGASLYVPFTLAPGGRKTIRLMMAWYAPETVLRYGRNPQDTVVCDAGGACQDGACATHATYAPWYAGRFDDALSVVRYWRDHYDELRKKSKVFTDAFYDTSLPDEVIEAVAANLTILKSPTVLRQTDGRLWCFEGCSDDRGCCIGTCTHVWNYAQAIPHLFPELERTLRETEFLVSQDARGHQAFRSSLPIRPTDHYFPERQAYGAADGQLGGIMKMYREWRISGDTAWLAKLWPAVKQSLDFCIQAWDPRGRGALEEPHHNTYDIEYWGPNGHCGSIYLGALAAAVKMGAAAGDDVSRYQVLLDKGVDYLESKLYNGEYFYQAIMTEGITAVFTPIDASNNGSGYRDTIETLNTQGPKYQYGSGCLSDGILGFWMAHVCGLDGNIVDREKIRGNLRAIYKYNLRHDLSEHANPQRPAYAMGDDGGLLLCTWPKGGELSIPFIYSNEVWTGIEYQVAAHLMIEGMVEEGLDIVRTCRDRYDGDRRNPFNEYECGHWYARALSSYGLLQGLTGVRYDAVEKTLYIDSKIGPDFRSFLATETGFGTAGLKNGKPFLEVKQGKIDVEHFAAHA